MGLEPTIFGSEVRRDSHFATAPFQISWVKDAAASEKSKSLGRHLIRMLIALNFLGNEDIFNYFEV